MKSYDFKGAKKFIQKYSDLIDEVSMGMREDWGWTSELVYSDKKFLVNLDNVDLDIAGISSSYWATPVMEVVFLDGEERMVDCFIGESTGDAPKDLLGVWSKPIQDYIDNKYGVKLLK